MAMGKGKQIGLVLVLGVVAVGLLAYRIPGVADEVVRSFEQGWDESRTLRQSSISTSTLPREPLVLGSQAQTATTPDTVTALRDEVRNRRLSTRSEYTIGQQLDWSFRDPTWHRVALHSGAVVVRFEGSLGPDAAVDVRHSLIEHLSNSRLDAKRRDLFTDAVSEVQAGTRLQLDFDFHPDGRLVYVRRLQADSTRLAELGLPASIWLERILQ